MNVEIYPSHGPDDKRTISDSNGMEAKWIYICDDVRADDDTLTLYWDDKDTKTIQLPLAIIYEVRIRP